MCSLRRCREIFPELFFDGATNHWYDVSSFISMLPNDANNDANNIASVMLGYCVSVPSEYETTIKYTFEWYNLHFQIASLHGVLPPDEKKD